jgi:hypothetical protein
MDVMTIRLVRALTASLLVARAHTPSAFEVISVKPNLSGLDQSFGINILGSRIHGENLPLRTLILQAYGLLDFQIVGGRRWLASDRYDIEATTGLHEVIRLSELGPLALDYRIAVQQPFLGRTVIDKTGPTRFYDFTLEWDAGDDAGSSILAALRSQLGLTLSSEKGPVVVLVIDSAEKPVAN